MNTPSHIDQWTEQMRTLVLQHMRSGMSYGDAVSAAFRQLARPRNWPDAVPTRYGAGRDAEDARQGERR